MGLLGNSRNTKLILRPSLASSRRYTSSSSSAFPDASQAPKCLNPSTESLNRCHVEWKIEPSATIGPLLHRPIMSHAL